MVVVTAPRARRCTTSVTNSAMPTLIGTATKSANTDTRIVPNTSGTIP